MEEQRRIYRGFLAVHAPKARATTEPTAHVMFQKPDMSVYEPLIAMTREELLEELDGESELVRWLLWQMTTYDCYRQKIVALVFDRSTVLSDVMRHDGSIPTI